MNKKNSNAWILCPSKSFPGKLYYFNVITGEAAWCLTEDEKKTLAQDVTIKKEKNHCYPEPSTPPTDDAPDMSNICYNFTPQPNLPLNYHMGPVPIFNQPLFSRYVPNHYMPGYMIPMPQMYVPPVTTKHEPKKRSFDQITQTSDIQVHCVQGYTIPLSKRFGTYRQQNVGTKIFGSKSKCGLTQNKGDTFTSNKVNWSSVDSSKVNSSTVQGGIFGPKLSNCNESKASTSKRSLFISNLDSTVKTNTNRLIKEPILKINRKENVNVQNITNTNQKADIIRKSISNQGTEKEIKNKHITVNSATNPEIEVFLRKSVLNTQNLKMNKENWVQMNKIDYCPKESVSELITSDVMNETENEEHNVQKQLNNDDLRFVLEAKRRKLQSENLDPPEQTHDVLLSTTQPVKNDVNKLKDNVKQVRFDLENQTNEDTEEETVLPEESDVQTMESDIAVATYSAAPQVINITYLRSLAKPFMKMDPWYVVVDIGVLLDDFEFIEDFVRKDATCRLLVPNSVRSYIETMSVGEYGGRSWVMLARKAMRRLKTMEDVVVLQPPIMETSTTSAIDGTIECCLQVLEGNHAVLVTTETELYTKGVESGIHTFKLDDLKNSIDPEPQFSLSKGISIEIQNDNIFMQNTDKFEAFPLSKIDSKPQNNSDIFKVPTTVKKTQRKRTEANKVDVTNSVILDKSNGTSNVNNINRPSANKIKLIRKKFNVQDKVDKLTTIEQNIEQLSINDDSPQRDESADNSNGILHRHVDFNMGKIVVNTDRQNKDNKDEKNLQHPKGDQWKMFEKPFLRDHNFENVQRHVTSPLELGIKMKPLTVTVPSKPQMHSEKKVQRKINAYTLEESLKKFHVKDAAMSHRIEHRLDEWVCCFYQIMEDCLSHTLMNNTKDTRNKLSAPWTLLEAVLCVKEIYCDDTAIKTISDKLCSILSNFGDKNENLTNKMKSWDFMKLFGCGVLLVDSLKTNLPESVQVVESQKLLSILLHDIQSPSTDVDLPFTPLRVARSEIDADTMKRNIVQKKPSEIIAYLKQHFPAWKDFDESHLPDENTDKLEKQNPQEKQNPNEKMVVRTFGKKLNTIKINRAKHITFDDTPLQNKSECIKNMETMETNKLKDLPKITRIFCDVQKRPEMVKTKDQCNNDLIKQADKVLSAGKTNAEVESYKHRKDAIENEFDYEPEMYQDNFLPNVEIDDNATPFFEDVGERNDTTPIGMNNEISLFEEVPEKHNTVVSGFVNQSLDYCSFVRLFLAELSASFKLIYTFIDDSIQEFRRDGMRQKDRKVLYDKANLTHLYVTDIVGKFKRIIDREASENTKLKSIIINAGVEALADKRMTRYRHVIMKCLEQVQLLEGALKTMMALTNEHCDITAVDVDGATCHVPYFNIFDFSGDRCAEMCNICMSRWKRRCELCADENAYGALNASHPHTSPLWRSPALRLEEWDGSEGK